jgi:hypothetical protein
VKLWRGADGRADSPVDGELGNGESARVRGRARGGREGRGSAFYRERGGEGESPGGEGGRPTINGAIRERTWGRERETGGGFRLGRRTGAGAMRWQRHGREKRGRGERGPRWGPPVREREGRRVRARDRLGPSGAEMAGRLGFLSFFLFLFFSILKYK